MKRLADTAYWIYAIGAAGSTILAVLLYMPERANGARLVSPVIGGFNQIDILFAIMLLTLGYGLFLVMPLLHKKQIEQKILTTRAAELEVAVVTDPLTGLYNRRYFEDALNEYLVEFNRTQVPLAVLALDMDHFKSINDTYGHDAGDLVLKQLAARLTSLTREHDIVARTGGEEFCIVAPFSDRKQIEPFAERICKMVAEMRVDVGSVVIRPTISIGVASTADGDTTMQALMKASDQRLYKAKKQGRNRVCA